MLLAIQRVQREMPSADLASRGADAAEPSSSKATLKVSSCQAYDHLLVAALRSQVCLLPFGASAFRTAALTAPCGLKHKPSFTLHAVLHFMICHRKSAIGPAPQAVTKHSEVEQNTGVFDMHDNICLDMRSSS